MIHKLGMPLIVLHHHAVGSPNTLSVSRKHDLGDPYDKASTSSSWSSDTCAKQQCELKKTKDRDLSSDSPTYTRLSYKCEGDTIRFIAFGNARLPGFAETLENRVTFLSTTSI
uniref:AlNc14C30G2835 protein n=1 Tax=Albugo laibachii Nc14 TaxID=890382 RepID=F0W7N0_9STRA|nr:AlNc14C30G2835 [Albugo laibachii Nc14]|eukprot:CCA17131.1 AlNc14C30G2835 [Albugo laibachii Nc14]